ncbi:hypothetical protein FACS1894166_06020 [Bacilli bacterium]|nr:hypothetical protein FACS1894166_06020 [Bacilli bacterium]
MLKKYMIQTTSINNSVCHVKKPKKLNQRLCSGKYLETNIEVLPGLEMLSGTSSQAIKLAMPIAMKSKFKQANVMVFLSLMSIKDDSVLLINYM